MAELAHAREAEEKLKAAAQRKTEAEAKKKRAEELLRRKAELQAKKEAEEAAEKAAEEKERAQQVEGAERRMRDEQNKAGIATLQKLVEAQLFAQSPRFV